MTVADYELTPCEEEIMYYIWEKGEVKSREVLEYFNAVKGKDWKKQTLNTYFTHLIEKGVLQAEGETRKIYSPAVSKKNYDHKKARSVVKKSYGGHVSNFVAAFCGSEKISLEEVEELQRMLDAKMAELKQD